MTFITVLNILQQLPSLLFVLEIQPQWYEKWETCNTWEQNVIIALQKCLPTQHIMICVPQSNIELLTEHINYLTRGWVTSISEKLLPLEGGLQTACSNWLKLALPKGVKQVW